MDSRRDYFVGCLTYKILESKQPSTLFEYYNYRVLSVDRATRAPAGNLIQPHCRTEMYRRSYRLTSIKFWNGFLKDIRNAKTLEDFKSKLYAHLLAGVSKYIF